MQDFFIGRQPIFDRHMRVYAYELLYRHGFVDRAVITDFDAASSEVVVNALTELGLDRLVGTRKAFCNFTRGSLIKGADVPFSTDQLVVEVLETVTAEASVVEALKSLSRSGHLIALDDFVLDDGLEPLVELADIVKIDVLELTQDEVREQVEKLRRIKKLKLLAEKVETNEEYQFCRRLGFDYFQGYFFSRPQVVSGRRLPPGRLAMLRLMTELQRPDIDLGKLEEIIETDVNLCVKLLRQINSSFYSLLSEVKSIRQAIVYLGLIHIRNWACIVAMGSVDDKPQELMTMALIRGKMCELLCRDDDAERRGMFFTVGLFSLLDSMFDSPMEEVLENLPLAQEVKAALLTRTGDIGLTLKCVEDYEQANWSSVIESGYDEDRVRDAYIESIEWSQAVMDSLES
ncbi:HDOD domain-containing protein [Desulfuromonas acetoxidans]|uniref:Diguanylate phosphodiesterase n=1 Tax=Desulfuromonas acetoxidans (strain DSM 684 / 11070) TaxID=281689 RepID=Q1JY34_DESA6|nr:HDOD domain-containing protein [Desulfuromonas acetoxidans]EAT15162.1 diguanylate phosphodiesterase [Desulfuromonas acetoxidans DSM 684]NVD23226.1 HDOD domain-containing protein [Desulfuromonas acetoxidans]NVE15533.1 HDOD domain-containing protein [Desulfuromonas acetoxidans]